MAIVLVGCIAWFISFINDSISRLAIYHNPKTKHNQNGESFWVKITRVFILFLGLSPFVLFSIYISLKFILIPAYNATPDEITSINNATIGVTPIATLVFLFLMRMLMNPTYNNFESIINIGSKEKTNLKKIKEVTLVFKERVNSFFSSYIWITLIIFVFYVLVNMMGSINATMFQNTINSIIPQLNSDSIIVEAAAYFTALIILTFFIEGLLYFGHPVTQTPWLRVKKQIPLTIDTFKTFGLSRKDRLLYCINQGIALLLNTPSQFVSSLKIIFKDMKRIKPLNKKHTLSTYYMEEETEEK